MVIDYANQCLVLVGERGDDEDDGVADVIGGGAAIDGGGGEDDSCAIEPSTVFAVAALTRTHRKPGCIDAH